MKLLLDSCLSGALKKSFSLAGHDVVWAGDFEKDPGDRELLVKAELESRVLITLDKDFGEIAIVHGQIHHGIIRLVNFSVREHAQVCLNIMSKYEGELVKGAIITAEPGRLRIRPPEPQ